MADNLQGQPGPDATTTAAETTPDTPVTAPVETGAAEATPATPNPAPASPEVDWGKVDAGAYADLKRQFQEGTLPVQTADKPDETAAEKPPTEEAEKPPVETKPLEEEEVPNRFRFSDPKDKAIAALKKANPDLSWSEAEERVTGKPARAAEAAPVAAPESPEAIQTRIDAMDAEMEKAGEMADTVNMAKLLVAKGKAEKELNAARAQEQAAQRQQDATALKDIESAKQTVRGKYPAIKDTASPLSKRFNEIFDRWEATPNSPFLQLSPAEQMTTAASLAAAELGIAPVDPTKPPAAAPVKAPPSTVPPSTKASPVQPASGAARTATPSNAAAQLMQEVDSVKTMDEYEALKAKAFATR